MTRDSKRSDGDQNLSLESYAMALADAVMTRLTTAADGAGMSFRVPEFERAYDGPLTPWSSHLDALEADCFGEISADTPEDAAILAERLLFRVARVSARDDLETVCTLLAGPLDRAFAARPHPRLFRLWCLLTAPIEAPRQVM